MTPGTLVSRIVSSLHEATMQKCADISLRHACVNATRAPQASVFEIKQANLPAGDAALVIAAGPSLHRTNTASRIKSSGFKGTIIATESAMAYCLRNGIVPHLVVTLDPHPSRIVRWFGDPNLSNADLEADDYYRRQDLDPAFSENELRRNEELKRLVDQNGHKIIAAVASCASTPVVDRCIESGMSLYWWNPLFDDYEKKDSLTRKIFELNQLPCLNTGGNVGTSAWVIAHAVLGKKNVALTGMDFSYYSDTDHKSTQYYYEIRDLVGAAQLKDAFTTVHNKHLSKSFYTDPTYFWYREAFLEMAKGAECTTYNCTEGGILFGDSIEQISLEEFVESHN